MVILGNMYFTRVDPLFKLLHRPTTLSLIYTATQNKKNITKGQEALLFAIYFAAVTSLTDDECSRSLAYRKQDLVAKTKTGIEKALSNANFLDTTDMTVLQAFLIYLVGPRYLRPSTRADLL